MTTTPCEEAESRTLSEAETDALTIQEMARQSGLSEHTLRYYERIGLIAPIPRDGSSGHRRYPPETVGLVESLACLRGTGMSIEDMRRYLKLRERGPRAASEQQALFASLKAQLEREMAVIQTRLTYLSGKVAYWEAIAAGDTATATAHADANRRIAHALTTQKEDL